MKKLIALSVLSTAIFTGGFAGSADAATWSPNGPVNLSSVGPLMVSKSVTLFCDVAGTATLSGSSASIGSSDPFASLQLIGGLCGLLIFVDQPYNLKASDLDTVTLENVRMYFFGNEECAGDLTGSFDQATGQITFLGATLPTSQGLGDCTFTGTIATSPAVSYTIP